MDRTKIITYLGVLAALVALALALPNLITDIEPGLKQILQLVGYAWAPALAAWITQSWIYKGSMARYGWNRKRFSFDRVFGTIGIGIGVILGSMLVVFLAGNVLHLPGFGEIIIQPKSAHIQHLLDQPTNLGAAYGYMSLNLQALLPMEIPGPFITLIVIFVVLAITAGVTVNMLFTLGREMGFRGFLVAETRSMGFVGSSFVIGIVSGLYALSYIGVLTGWERLLDLPQVSFILGYHVAASFILTWLSVKFRSVYAPASLQGVVSNLAVVTYFFMYGGHPIFNSVQGVAGITVFLLIGLIIILRDKKFIESYQTYRF